jgi:acyl-CoA thioesterase FadM
MKLYFRMLPMAVRGLRGAPVDATEPVRTQFRVLPADLDVNLHLNNGRYMQLIDVNRLEWALRTRVLHACFKQGWRPILGSSAIHFRRELRLFDRGIAETRLAGWDDRWFFFEHRVETLDGRTVATSLAKAAFRSASGWVPTSAMIALAAPDMAPLNLPEHVVTWQALDQQFGRMARNWKSGSPAPVEEAA